MNEEKDASPVETKPVDLKKVGLNAAHDRRWGESHGYTNDWLIEARQGRRYGFLVALPTLEPGKPAA